MRRTCNHRSTTYILVFYGYIKFLLIIFENALGRYHSGLCKLKDIPPFFQPEVITIFSLYMETCFTPFI